MNTNLVIRNVQLQNECLCLFHFEALALRCEMTIMPLEQVWGMTVYVCISLYLSICYLMLPNVLVQFWARTCNSFNEFMNFFSIFLLGKDNNRIGNKTGLGRATPTPFPSQSYKSLSHPHPKPGTGRGGAGRVNVSRSHLQKS